MIDPLLVPMLVLGYAIGSAPIARIFSQIWAGIDIREFGTGNPGAANVYRNVGLAPAVLVAVCNFMQGLGSVLLARAVGLDELQSMLVGLSAMAGYGWPVTQRFRGGRGVAVTIGVIERVCGRASRSLDLHFFGLYPDEEDFNRHVRRVLDPASLLDVDRLSLARCRAFRAGICLHRHPPALGHLELFGQPVRDYRTGPSTSHSRLLTRTTPSWTAGRASRPWDRP